MTELIKNQPDDAAILKFRADMQNFTARLNQPPEQNAVGATPDNRAYSMLISHIEMLLDEYYFGLWSTDDFKWEQIANEIVGSIKLTVVHPVSGLHITRIGAGAITIMVDKVPPGVDKNLWALDMKNKKSNALDMGFPKLKAECLKNAAISLGKHFGRDINRGEKQDTYSPLQPNIPDRHELQALFEAKKHLMTPDELSHAQRILDNEEVKSYFKLLKKLQSYDKQ
jgi:hypothetical protein